MKKNLGIMALIAMGWFYASSTFAMTPGNLTLNNVAKLTYTGNSTGITAETAVTVNVIASTPTLTTVTDIVKAEGQSITTEAEYTVTATNNGSDVYTFTPSTLVDGTGLGNASGTDFTAVAYVFKNSGGSTITNIALGASALQVISTAATSIFIPSDGGTDPVVNGLEKDDTIIINGQMYTITNALSDTGVAGSTVEVVLDTAIAAGLPIGTGLFEQTTFTVETNAAQGVGNQSDDGVNGIYQVTTTLTPTLSLPASSVATDTFQVTIVNVTIEKYVRNVTRGNCTGACTALNIVPDAGGITFAFYQTDGSGDGAVNARPGEDLEYVLQITTPSAGAIAAAVISDVLADFTIFKTGTLFMNQAAVSDEGGTGNADGNTSNATTGGFPLHPSADDGGLFIQTAAPAGGAEGDGIVAGGSTVTVAYQVDVS